MSDVAGADTAEFRLVALVLSAALRDQLARHAETAYPVEACGALLGHSAGSGQPIVTQAVPLANSEPSGGDGYRISSNLLCALPAHGEGSEERLLGFYHSHPDRTSRPSNRDLRNGHPGLLYVAVSVRSGRAGARTAWIISPGDAVDTDLPMGRSRARNDR